MIKSADLIARFQYALDNDWGYIYGTSGQTWTQAQQDKATREQTVKWGQRWVGHYVADCSGLFVWAFKQLGGKIYHGSNTIWNKYCSKQGKLINGRRADGYKLRPGAAVFLLDNTGRHHIGLYVGDGVCIEAKGTYYGVVASGIAHWDEWGELKDVDYSAYADEQEGERLNPTLRKGDSGDDVRDLQEILNQYGYKLDTDGKFGAKTESAVKAFQQSHYLTPDGIVGEKTWDALKPGLPDEAGDNLFVLTMTEAKELYNHVQAAYAILHKYMG